MSQNNGKVEFIFTDRAIDQALSNLEVLGFCDQDPILLDDLIKKEYIIHELEHFKPIPWLIQVASITEKGRNRLQAVEKEDFLKPESERLTKYNPYKFDTNKTIYMGYLIFTSKKIQEEIEEGRLARIARLSASNAAYMNNGDDLSRRYPEYFGPNSEHEYA